MSVEHFFAGLNLLVLREHQNELRRYPEKPVPWVDIDPMREVMVVERERARLGRMLNDNLQFALGGES